MIQLLPWALGVAGLGYVWAKWGKHPPKPTDYNEKSDQLFYVVKARGLSTLPTTPKNRTKAKAKLTALLDTGKRPESVVQELGKGAWYLYFYQPVTSPPPVKFTKHILAGLPVRIDQVTQAWYRWNGLRYVPIKALPGAGKQPEKKG